MVSYLYFHFFCSLVSLVLMIKNKMVLDSSGKFSIEILFFCFVMAFSGPIGLSALIAVEIFNAIKN